MKKLSLLALSAFVLLTNSNSLAQSVPQNQTLVLHKVTQIGHVQSGANTNYVLKGARMVKGVVTDNYKISGVNNNKITQDCLELASKQNINSLQQTSNLQINFSYAIAFGSGVSGAPTNSEFQKTVIKSCYLTNN